MNMDFNEAMPAGWESDPLFVYFGKGKDAEEVYFAIIVSYCFASAEFDAFASGMRIRGGSIDHSRVTTSYFR